ncbi:MAG: sugar phosphate isomerase/epimerase family protein [Acidimicrobiales bacterium]
MDIRTTGLLPSSPGGGPSTGTKQIRRRLANAPVSFGVFELTVGQDPIVDPDRFLDLVAHAGYTGVDLGPVGYLGNALELSARLRTHGLGLAGGWMSMTLSDKDTFEKELTELDQVLDLFEAGAGDDQEFWPKPTLADAGSPALRSHLGRQAGSRSLDGTAWAGLVSRAQLAAARVRERGFQPTFHHHLGTYVESPEQIDRFLYDTDIDLCLDTGHLLAAAGDPVEVFKQWGQRINHLHVKDCRRAEAERILAGNGSVEDIWSDRVFCALGAGSLDVDTFLRTVRTSSYSGWLVIEQDIIPGADDRLESIAAEQKANLDCLRRYGLS